ncbi:MAG: hypothetical protein AB7H90_03405 [Alphaproteobacteria bacterium]
MQYIIDLWRSKNEARSKMGARQFDAHDRELFCLGLYAASAAIAGYNASTQDISEIAELIERSRG